MITSSPSCRNVRVSPFGRVTASAPPRVSSSRHPRASSARAPRRCRCASRSPGRRLQPLLAWCASICAKRPVHPREIARLSRRGGRAALAHASRAHADLERQRERAALAIGRRVEVREGAADRPQDVRTRGTRNGSSASKVTTQGEIVVAKFFARNGPSGWYSHCWMSRADQSLTQAQTEHVRVGVCDRDRIAEGVSRPDEDTDLELVVEPLARAERAASRVLRAPGLAHGPPHGRAADDDRRGAAVIADRHLLVVRQQRVVRPEHPADVGRVIIDA